MYIFRGIQSMSIRPLGFLLRARKVQPAFLDSLRIVNGRIRRGIGRTQGWEWSESDDIPKLRRIPRRRCAICEISCLVRRVRLCTACIPSFIHLLHLSPAAPFLPHAILLVRSASRSLARSLALATCLSLSFFDVILLCYYMYHRSRSAIREVAEKRDERRSRKEISKLTFYLFYIDRVTNHIIFANVQIVFIIFEKLYKTTP